MKTLTKALRSVGLTHARTAELLGLHRGTVADKARGRVCHTGDVIFIATVWGLLSDTQKAEVATGIAALRSAVAMERLEKDRTPSQEVRSRDNDR